MDRPVVFVIDDDESICRSLRRLIHSVGLDVRTFNSGNDFLNQGCQNMSGCILLDVRMPEIGGLELQKRLNDFGCKMPIIFMTAHQDTGTREKAFDAGAVAFLLKPFEDQVLMEAIRSALNKCADEQSETNHEET
jgi:two-component system, LuxR family, response regulator FixJ